MFNENIQKGLNKQLNREFESSHLYLMMGILTESKGFNGVSKFLYDHSNEERSHMINIIKYINKRSGTVIINKNISLKERKFLSLREIFYELFCHEKKISKEINILVELSLEVKDYFTYNFLQWYVSEQIEEETLSKCILDKITLLENNNIGLYLFDKELKKFNKKHTKI
ncbi:ferritin [Blattabacterium cuenoti]|uniref:ferritin n=1 Tax=Blattabacterium cuenoti TaxID=1653831 RepID=UPI00163BF1D2|nr:ferritin [Blattabacterium cuenoti]